MAFIIGSSSLESEDGHQTCHEQVNVRPVFIPTISFRALNNPEGVSQTTRPNLCNSLGVRLVQYTQHNIFEAPKIHNQPRPILVTPQYHM